MAKEGCQCVDQQFPFDSVQTSRIVGACAHLLLAFAEMAFVGHKSAKVDHATDGHENDGKCGVQGVQKLHIGALEIFLKLIKFPKYKQHLQSHRARRSWSNCHRIEGPLPS